MVRLDALGAISIALLIVLPHPNDDLPGVEPVVTNDPGVPAGTLSRGVLTVSLEVREGAWQDPVSGARTPQAVFAFSADGGRLAVPGPVLRVPAGTRIRATVRNSTDHALMLHGLEAAQRSPEEAVLLPPGSTRRLNFQAPPAGTHVYRGVTVSAPQGAAGKDATLTGLLIVDGPPAATPSGSDGR